MGVSGRCESRVCVSARLLRDGGWGVVVQTGLRPDEAGSPVTCASWHSGVCLRGMTAPGQLCWPPDLVVSFVLPDSQ